MDLSERIKRCIARHPEWDSHRIASSTGGRYADIEAVKKGEALPPPPSNIMPDVAAPVTPATSAASISLSTIREKLDVAAMIRRQVARIGKGQLLVEDEVCRMTAGRDRNRFRRAVENNADEFRAHRIKLRLDESTEGKWFWGRADDVAEALRIRDL